MRSRNPFGRRHQRSADHLQRCGECAAAVQRERQYIQRLRDAAVPAASEELTARLLSRTEHLAATPRPAAVRRSRVGVRALMAGGAAAAAAGILAVSALALAGEERPLAGPALTGGVVQQTAQLPSDGRNLTAGQLSSLRSEGWICPELESLGFQLRSANAITVNGMPAVELHLSNGPHYATVVEQHPGDASAGNGNGVVVSRLAPWTATYETAAGRFTFESDLPADLADDALPVLQRLSAAAAEGAAAGMPPAAGPAAAQDSPGARLERGIRKIGEFLTP